MFLKTLKQLTKKDVNIAGGKGASLGEMTQAGIPVPPGFVLLAGAFDRFLKENDLTQEIEAQLKKVNYDDINSVDKASSVIRDLIYDAKMPIDLKKEIIEEFKKLKVKFVAVRSSATAEDSSIASWAGELESYLNTTEKTLLENVKKCWSSLFTPRAIFYRKEKKLLETNVSVAVVVQEMIESEISGITFTVHPITEDRNQMIIESAWGLGEAIVSGSVTPDSYVLDKTDWSLIDVNVNEQKKQIVRDSGKGVKWIEVKKTEQEKQKFQGKEIIELAKLCDRIEKHYKKPQDIEWAYKNEKFYIVQSRPITTLNNVSTGEKRRVYRKIFNRYLPIYAAEYNYIGKTDAIKKITGGSANFPPLYINIPSRGNDVYYDAELYDNASQKAFNYFKKNPDKMRIISDDYKKLCESNFDFVKNAQVKDIKKLFDLNANHISPMMTILILIGREEFDPEMGEVASIAKRIRYWNDKFLYEVGLKIFELINKKFSWPQNSDKADYVTIDEVLSGNLPNEKEFNERKKSWVLLEGNKLYTGRNIDKFLNKNNIILKKEEVIKNLNSLKIIKGNIAERGLAKGKAKIVFTINDLFKVKSGDILVSSMTGPDFMIAIKKSAAIITDEGGVTCHAAIVSRELSIPCIIGAKIATKVLRDGDVIEVDANEGIVKILKRKK